MSSTKRSRQIARPAVEWSWSRDYINKILYIHIKGTYHPIVERRNLLHASMVYVYLLSNDQTTGVEKIINNSWTLQRRGICAHAYNTSKKKNLSVHITLCCCSCAYAKWCYNANYFEGIAESLWTNIIYV